MNEIIAVIYCRVSSERQVLEGHGLDSQETRCQVYAREKQYKVVAVFKEKGISGATLHRPEFTEMIKFVSKLKATSQVVVIVDDIKRFARDIEVHLELKRTVKKAGALLESPSFRFEDNPYGRYMEKQFALNAELDRELNTEQVKNRMRSRLQAGYWTFYPPLGYTSPKNDSRGERNRKSKVLVRHEPIASLLQQAFERFADDRLQTQNEVLQYLLKSGVKTSRSRVNLMIKNVFYAGYIEYPSWGVELTKGCHPPIISLETFQKIQEKLENKATKPYNTDLAKDFPLRSVLKCSGCGRCVTGYWTQGRTGKYPYYSCKNKDCKFKYQSVAKYLLENEFEQELSRVTPADSLIRLLKATILKLWESKEGESKVKEIAGHREIAEIDNQIKKFIQRISVQDDDTLIETYEKKVLELKKQKLLLEQNSPKNKNPESDVRTALEIFELMVKNLVFMWKCGDLGTRKMILKFVYSNHLEYDRFSGFRTADLSLHYGLFRQLDRPSSRVVEMAGVAPTSNWGLRRKLFQTRHIFDLAILY